MYTINTVLQISIPTYNRPEQIEHTLSSLASAVSFIDEDARQKITIGIYNNSTKKIISYKKIINNYEKIFKELNVAHFFYKVTGFDILSWNNVSMSVLLSKAEYTWVLPDDDLARLDSIKTILDAIEQCRPCMVHGGIKNKTILDYSETKIEFDGIENSIFQIVEEGKAKRFMETKGIQLQEHVYRTELLEVMFCDDNLAGAVDDFIPALFGLICCKSSQPLVLLSESIGIFRNHDPKSGWRYKWLYICLIQWRDTVDKFVNSRLINTDDVEKTKRIYINELYKNNWRPDALLGFNSKFTINPINMTRHYQFEYIRLLLASPFLFIINIVSIKSSRDRLIKNLKHIVGN
jgi:hypothetical protein